MEMNILGISRETLMLEDKLKIMSANLNPTNFLEYLSKIRAYYSQNEKLREFSTHLHRLRQNFSIINITHPNKFSGMQFFISEERRQTSVQFWINFDPQKEIFDIFTGVNHDAFVTIKIVDFQIAITLAHGTIWAIKELLDKHDPKLSLLMLENGDFAARMLYSQMLLDFSGILGDFGTFFWSAPRD